MIDPRGRTTTWVYQADGAISSQTVNAGGTDVNARDNDGSAYDRAIALKRTEIIGIFDRYRQKDKPK